MRRPESAPGQAQPAHIMRTRTRVKFCGICRELDALSAVSLGVDALGGGALVEEAVVLWTGAVEWVVQAIADAGG